jgi:hypothetical protein
MPGVGLGQKTNKRGQASPIKQAHHPPAKPSHCQRARYTYTCFSMTERSNDANSLESCQKQMEATMAIVHVCEAQSLRAPGKTLPFRAT